MIPKVIHYCWFGRGPKSELMQKCMDSWKNYCPDWEIVEWNEDNFDVNFCPYAAKAYREKRYSFLADAARLKIIFENGGVYLDTDVELIHSLDNLLDNSTWFGYGTYNSINTGSGFGAVKGHPLVKRLLENYMVLSASSNYKLCTEVDTDVFRQSFPEFAADHDVAQMLFYEGVEVRIIHDIWRYVVHHYANTWQTPAQKVYSRLNSFTKGSFGKLKDKLRS